MQKEKSTTTLRKNKDEHSLYKRAVLISFIRLYGQTVLCLLGIAIGRIRTEIFLNALVQIKAHSFRISDPETANAVGCRL